MRFSGIFPFLIVAVTWGNEVENVPPIGSQKPGAFPESAEESLSPKLSVNPIEAPEIQKSTDTLNRTVEPKKNTVKNETTSGNGYNIANLFAEAGIFFPEHDDLKDDYKVESIFNLSYGIQFGKSDWNYLPWIRGGSFEVERTITTTQQGFPSEKTVETEHKLSRIQLAAGLSYFISTSTAPLLYLDAGVSYNILESSLDDVEEKLVGMIFGVGLQQRINRALIWNLNYAYEFANSNSAIVKSWSGSALKLSLGVNLAWQPK